MLKTENAIAYRCPKCSEEVFGAVSAFCIDGGKIKLKCACTGSSLEAVISDDGKIELSVPCIFCPTNHTYRLEKDVFFSKDLFALGCPQTGLPACFIGPAEEVSRAVEENENEIKRIAAEAGIDLNTNTNLTVDTESIKQQLLVLLGILQHEKRIICDCEEKKDAEYSLTVESEGVEIRCKKCGAKRFFRARNTLDCEYLSDIDLLYLE